MHGVRGQKVGPPPLASAEESDETGWSREEGSMGPGMLGLSYGSGSGSVLVEAVHLTSLVSRKQISVKIKSSVPCAHLAHGDTIPSGKHWPL